MVELASLDALARARLDAAAAQGLPGADAAVGLYPFVLMDVPAGNGLPGGELR